MTQEEKKSLPLVAPEDLLTWRDVVKAVLAFSAGVYIGFMAWILVH